MIAVIILGLCPLVLKFLDFLAYRGIFFIFIWDKWEFSLPNYISSLRTFEIASLQVEGRINLQRLVQPLSEQGPAWLTLFFTPRVCLSTPDSVISGFSIQQCALGFLSLRFCSPPPNRSPPPFLFPLLPSPICRNISRARSNLTSLKWHFKSLLHSLSLSVSLSFFLSLSRSSKHFV